LIKKISVLLILLFNIDPFETLLNFLACAQNFLDYAKCEVKWLVNEGKISPPLADILIEKISKIQIDMGMVNNPSK